MVVSTSLSIPVGHYAFTVIASEGVVSASTPATLDVSAGTPPRRPDLAVYEQGFWPLGSVTFPKSATSPWLACLRLQST
jgi:hypothetical protein